MQILLSIATAFTAVYFFTRLRNRALDTLLFMTLALSALFFIIMPEQANALAHTLGVGRGADLVFYTSIMLFWFVVLKLYIKIRDLEQQLTRLVRNDAFLKARKDA